MTDKRHILRTLCWSTTAGFLGAGVALLFAPQAGRRTRRQLRRFQGDMKDRLVDLHEDLQENVEGIVDDLEGLYKRGLNQTRRVTSRIGDDYLRPLYASRELLERQIGRAEKFIQEKKGTVH